MAKIAALFPGQGSQTVGMGRDLAETWAASARVFEAVDTALGRSLSDLCWNGPEDRLRLTENTQPALLAHSVAAWATLKANGFAADGAAGHSLGEYSAVVAAGGLAVEDAARTVERRGRLMQEAVPVGEGAMAAIIGLDDSDVVAVCSEVSNGGIGVVVTANFNSPGQVVIAGTAAAVARASDRCKEEGARRALPLPVSAPFHSPLMAPARAGLEPTLRGLAFQPLEIPLYRNVDAAAVNTAHEVCDGLVRQMDSPVLWTSTIRQMRADGFDTFVEIGAGNVLCGLVRRIDRDAVCYPAGTVESVEKVLADLAS